MLSFVYDLSNIAAGVILAATVLGNLKSVGDELSKLSQVLRPFHVTIGGISLAFGVLYLLKPGCALHDIIAILAGVVLLGEAAKKIPSVGESISKLSKGLAAFETLIGIAVLAVGILGLLNIPLFC